MNEVGTGQSAHDEEYRLANGLLVFFRKERNEVLLGVMRMKYVEQDDEHCGIIVLVHCFTKDGLQKTYIARL